MNTQFPLDDLSGKTVLVIGAGRGIGYDAAKHLAKMHPGRLILTCRNDSCGEVFLTKLKQETNYLTAEVWTLDLANVESIKAFVERFEKESDQLDLLVENADIKSDPGRSQNDRWKPSLQPDTLSTSLLALLLVPTMLQTIESYRRLPRVLIVWSKSQYWTKFHKNFIEGANSLLLFGGDEVLHEMNADNFEDLSVQFYDTKLLNVLFARTLAAQLGHKTQLILNVVNPLSSTSPINEAAAGVMTIVRSFLEKVLSWSAQEGASQVIWAALGLEKGQNFLSNCPDDLTMQGARHDTGEHLGDREP